MHICVVQGKLLVLRLSHNQLRHLGSSCLAGLSSLTHLHLDHNQLEQLGAGWLLPCPLLAHLDLAHNRLASLDGLQAFDGGRHLRSLSLAANQLTEPPVLAHLSSLQRLSLSANSLHSPLFSLCELVGPLSLLEELSLADTELSSLGPAPCLSATAEDTALTFPALTSLDISGNWLQFPLPVLAHFPRLEHLSICQQNMTSLQRGALAGLGASLRSLDLVNCPRLASLEAGVFPGHLLQLETITIHHCPRLEMLPAGLVQPSSSTTPTVPSGQMMVDDVQALRGGGAGARQLTITAADNGIRWVEAGSLPWPEVARLDLSGNPLDCNCELTAAWDALSAASVTVGAATDTMINGPQLLGVCGSPEALAGRNVSELSAAELACSFDQLMLGPLEVSVLAVGLVLAALAVGIVSFLVYQSGRKVNRGPSSSAVGDVGSPPLVAYLPTFTGGYGGGASDAANWKEKERIYSVTDEWSYMAPACDCTDGLYLNHQPGAHLQGILHRDLAAQKAKETTGASAPSYPLEYRTLYGQPELVWSSKVRVFFCTSVSLICFLFNLRSNFVLIFAREVKWSEQQETKRFAINRRLPRTVNCS